MQKNHEWSEAWDTRVRKPHFRFGKIFNLQRQIYQTK